MKIKTRAVVLAVVAVGLVVFAIIVIQRGHVETGEEPGGVATTRPSAPDAVATGPPVRTAPDAVATRPSTPQAAPTDSPVRTLPEVAPRMAPPDAVAKSRPSAPDSPAGTAAPSTPPVLIQPMPARLHEETGRVVSWGSDALEIAKRVNGAEQQLRFRITPDTRTRPGARESANVSVEYADRSGERVAVLIRPKNEM